jgi:hypothetical protein
MWFFWGVLPLGISVGGVVHLDGALDTFHIQRSIGHAACLLCRARTYKESLCLKKPSIPRQWTDLQSDLCLGSLVNRP